MSYGYLTKKPGLRERWPYRTGFGDTPEIPPTRAEEYLWADSVTQGHPGRLVLDAACGWVAEWHIFSEIQAEDRGRTVVALDANPEHLFRFRPHSRIVRMTGDIGGMPFADKAFPLVFCISVLEHLPVSAFDRAFRELLRVCADTVVLTADEQDAELMAQLLRDFGFEPGAQFVAEGEMLEPNVAAAVARRVFR